MSNTDPTTSDYTFDHLDNEQLMTAINEFRKEAVRLVEQGRSLLEALFIHNTDPEAHIDLRTAIAQLERKLGEDITGHNVDENSHPFLIARCNELAAAIQKLRDDMIPAINSAVLTHNIDPDSHSEAMHKHDTDPNAHRNIIDEIMDFINNHDKDENAHSVLFEYLKTADIFRYSRIGEVMPGHLMGDYSQGMFIPADGRYVDVTLYPELRAKIQQGHLYVVNWDDTKASTHPGIWMRHKDHHHLYSAPNFSAGGDRSMKFSTTEGMVGYAEKDATVGGAGGYFSCGRFIHSGYNGAQSQLHVIGGAFRDLGSQYGGIDGGSRADSGCVASRVISNDVGNVVTVASEIRVKSIYQYPVIYLGARV